MSVNGVSGVGGVVPPVAAAAPAEATRASSPKPIHEVEIDQATQQPKPPRFPWLSRLSAELEPASKQPSPYGSTPLLGERLDRQA